MPTPDKELQLKESEDEVLLKKGYRILKKLGEGSYAPVYFTEYTVKNDPDKKDSSENGDIIKLACKIIDTRRAPRDYVKKFLPRELDIMSKMNHPHIVHIQSIFQRKFRYLSTLPEIEENITPTQIMMMRVNTVKKTYESRRTVRLMNNMESEYNYMKISFRCTEFGYTFVQICTFLAEFSLIMRYFIFMRMEHTDLLDCILENGPISEARSRLWLRQLTLAVQYLHEMGVAHRDLKTENCLISFNNNLKLADFSFARYVIDSNDKRLTSATYCGSLNYAAPEVLMGSPYYPKNSDCWSIGVILYAMVNKAMPFEDKNVKNLVEQQMTRKWRFRSRVIDILSPEVKNLTKHLLEPDPTLRYLTDEIMASDWIKLDPHLSVLTPDEDACLKQAKEIREKYIEKLKRKGKVSGGKASEGVRVMPAFTEQRLVEEDGIKVLKRSITKDSGGSSRAYQSRTKV